MKLRRIVGCCAMAALSVSLWAFVARADEVRQSADAADGAAESPPTMCRCAGGASQAAVRINRVLSEPLKSTGLNFSDEPLESIASFLQDEYDIPIQLDVPALEDAGLTQDEPISVNVRSVSLRSALRLMFRSKSLTYVIQNEVLIITTPEEAESELVVCVYDVRNLVGGDRDNREIKSLADAVVSCIAPNTWAVRKGGEAEIRTLRPGLLVISQTQAVHELIAELLNTVRETLRQPIQPPAEAGMGAMGGRGGYGFDGRELEGGGGGGFGGGFGFGYGRIDQRFGESYGGRGGETDREPTPAEESPLD